MMISTAQWSGVPGSLAVRGLLAIDSCLYQNQPSMEHDHQPTIMEGYPLLPPWQAPSSDAKPTPLEPLGRPDGAARLGGLGAAHRWKRRCHRGLWERRRSWRGVEMLLVNRCYWWILWWLTTNIMFKFMVVEKNNGCKKNVWLVLFQKIDLFNQVSLVMDGGKKSSFDARLVIGNGNGKLMANWWLVAG